MNDTLRKAMLLSWGAVLLALQGPAAVTASGFKLAGPDNGGVTLSWTVSGSAGGMFGGMYYLNGTYNVAVTRGTSSSQSAQSRIIVAGETSGAYMTQQNTNSGHVTDTPPATGQTYYYWLHYAPYSIIDDSANFFACYLGGSYSTIRSASCIGPISVFVPAPGPKKIKVTFNSNGGNGEMAEQEFESGVPQKLEKNHFSRDGYVFQGWSTAASGEEVEYQDEQEITVDSDMPLYAVWANPPLTLSPESADWAKGSITLKCEDADTSDTEHKYTLSYYDEDTDEWIDVDGAKDVIEGAKGKTFLKDGSFTSRIGGVKPVLYRVKDEVGRMSDQCATRTRYALLVGLSAYDPVWQNTREQNGAGRISELPQFENDARLMHEILTSSGGGIDCGNMVLLLNGNARIRDINREWLALASKTVPGDIIFFSISTHGAPNGVVVAYDGGYSREIFQHDLEPFRSGNCTSVKVVVMLNNCHSETMTSTVHDIGYEYGSVCTANILYLAVADSTEFGWSFGSHFQFGDILLDKGLRLHQADAQTSLEGIGGSFGNGNSKVDLLECAKYLGALAKGMSDKSPTHAQYDETKSHIMADTIVLSYDSPPSAKMALSAPAKCKVEASPSGIWILWDKVVGADYYIVFYRNVSTSSSTHWKYVNGYNSDDESFWTLISRVGWDNGFHFRTSDAATYQHRERYYPLDNDSDYQFWIVAVNAAGLSPSCFSDVIRSPVASQKAKYRIKFHANGGEVSPQTIDVEEDSKLGVLPTPVSRGRIFSGWYTARIGGLVVNEDTIVTQDATYYAHWKEERTGVSLPLEWLKCYPSVTSSSDDDMDVVAWIYAANGCRTVGECYALGINPEDPNDDLKITDFKMEGGMPVVTLNHTEDGSGKSFLPRVKMLGKANLADAEWREVPEGGDATMRFFKVKVEMP